MEPPRRSSRIMNMSYDYNYFASRVSTFKPEDITSSDHKAGILRSLMNNDSRFTELHVNHERDYSSVEGVEEAGWLGYLVGKHQHLKTLSLRDLDIATFCNGLVYNRSIEIVGLCRLDLSRGWEFQKLAKFFQNNSNIICLGLAACELGVNGLHSLSVALSGFTSLKGFALDQHNGESLVDVMRALGNHPELEEVQFQHCGLGGNEYRVLSSLLGQKETKIRALDIAQNQLGDVNRESLLAACANLSGLDISQCGITTDRGWQDIATMITSSSLEALVMKDIGVAIDKGVAVTLANALAGNETMNIFVIDENNITMDAWEVFSNLICDTSSISNTYRSNHTLRQFMMDFEDQELPVSLALNRMGAKSQVATMKILKHHCDFDMQPFFAWEGASMLPIVLGWLERADAVFTELDQAHNLAFEANIGTRGNFQQLTSSSGPCLLNYPPII